MNTGQETLKHSVPAHGAFVDYLASIGPALAALAGLAAVLSGFGSRLGWWYFMTGFSILKGAAIGGLVAAILSLLGGIFSGHERQSRTVVLAAAGVIIGLVTAGIPWSWMRLAEKMPVMHDITTDMANPPQFLKILPLRANAEDPAAYGGPSVAVEQQRAYPDIQPLVLPLPPEQAFNEALRTAQSMGWKIVDSSAREGRIEAVATTFWFGFKDDVVVRVAAAPGGSRIDVRSVSRVGASDLGTNARRVRAYLNKMGSAAAETGPGAGY